MHPTSHAPHRGRALTALALAVALGVTGAVVATPQTASAYADPVAWDGMTLDAGGRAIVNDFSHVQIAPGLDQIEYERLGTEGRQQLHILRVALADSNLYVDYIGNDAVTAPGTVTEFVEQRGAIAGINGDFFDINNSSAPLGVAISRDQGIMKSADAYRESAAAFSESGLGRVAKLLIEGSVTTPAGALDLYGINTLGASASAVTVYNAHWGTHTRLRAIPDGTQGVEVIVGADGTVRSAAATPDSSPLGAGEMALVTIDGGASAAALRALKTGDPVAVEYRLDPQNADIRAAVSGHPTSEPPMLEDGVIGEAVSPYMRERHPRTGVGFTSDGRTAFFVVADGRRTDAAGLTVPELAQLMLDLGARTAINLDGGGSSQMNTRLPGDTVSSVRNTPSDGYERRDANGLGIFLRTPGSGTIADIDVRPRIAQPDATRVFPGLTRSLLAVARDEAGSAAAGDAPVWTADSSALVVSASADDAGRGTALGMSPGRAAVTASAGSAAGARELSVLGDLQRLTASTGLLSFADVGQTRTLTIVGHDADGFQAPIEPSDIQITDVPDGLVSFEPSDDGTFTVTALDAPGGATATFRVGAHTVRVPMTVGLRDEVFADFSDAGGWAAANDRAPGGSIGAAEGYEGAPGLRLTYDFTQSTATRGQYAVAPNGGITLPGQPQKVTAWVHGDGNGAWPRLLVRQANGTSSNLDGPMITWNGWRKAEFTVPAGVSFPLTFLRARIMETRATASYSGEVRLSGLAVALAPEVEMPPTEIVEDDVVVADGGTEASPLRVAVVSDAQFVARNPDSEMAVGARRALREIVAAKPDVMIINGDFVDEASPDDFVLARRILDEELAGATFPWYYVPGNHEIMGGAIDNFVAAFGESHRTFDQAGTRFVLLDSSTGAISGAFDQVRMLQEALAGAASDPAISGVVVIEHHPIDDPLPTQASQLSRRADAALLRDWLEGFRQSSGKSAAFVGSHVGVFHATRQDGIPYLVNGNSGKAPAGAEFGEFTGWTMLGIDPDRGRWADATGPWLSSEVKVRVDAVRLGVSEASLTAGQRMTVAPVIDQPGNSGVEVAWPMSYRWGGDGLFVGDASAAPRSAIAAIDPATHEITALRAGAATATLTVNGVSAALPLVVSGGEVTVRGEAVQGETLTADLGDWPLPSGTELVYSWLRDEAAVDGAEASTYRVGAADAGARLSARVVVTPPGGGPLTYTSDPTSAVPFLQLSPVTPTLTGTAQVGSALRAVPGAWMPDGVELSYRWAVDGVEVADATAATFTPLPAHEGGEVTVTVSGAVPGYERASRTSAPLGPVAPAAVTPVPTLTLSADTVVAGGTVTLTGAGFAPRTSIPVWLHSEPSQVGTAAVGADGGFSLSVTIPVATSPGLHTLVLVDPVSGATTSAAITVVAAAEQPGHGLASSGGSVPVGLLWAGLGVLLLGAAAVALQRAGRRRRAGGHGDIPRS